MSMGKALPLYIIAGAVGLLALFSELTGIRLPLLPTPRAAVITLTLIGLLMCSLGAIGTFIKAPLHPITLAGYLLGAFAFLCGWYRCTGSPYLISPTHAMRLSSSPL